jgi:hypothetical protein
MKAQSHIKEWLRTEGRRKSWLAGQLAVNPATVSRWLGGKLVPSPQARIILTGLVGMDVTDAAVWRHS